MLICLLCPSTDPYTKQATPQVIFMPLQICWDLFCCCYLISWCFWRWHDHL